jgi:hypothetical protein
MTDQLRATIRLHAQVGDCSSKDSAQIPNRCDPYCPTRRVLFLPRSDAGRSAAPAGGLPPFSSRDRICAAKLLVGRNDIHHRLLCKLVVHFLGHRPSLFGAEQPEMGANSGIGGSSLALDIVWRQRVS